MKNEYEIRGDVTAVFLYRKGKTVEAIIDTVDLPKINEFENKWIANVARNGDIYPIITYKENGKEKSLKLHRLITNAPKGLVVDHINHDTLDNRSSNLRVCTYAENCQNYDRARKTNKSGVLGVMFHKAANKWAAQVRVKGMYYWETFETFEEAKEAVAKVRAKHLPYSQEALNKTNPRS